MNRSMRGAFRVHASAGNGAKPEPARSAHTPKLSVAEQLDKLRKARAESQIALREAQQRKISSFGSQLIDIRMYEQLEKTRDMLSERLSESQRTVSVQDEAIIARDKDLEKLHGSMLYLKMEADALARGLEGAAASIRPALGNNAEAIKQLDRIRGDLSRLIKAMEERTVEADKMRTREIPVVWFGVASEVRVMGTFDDWTIGQELNPGSLPDQVYTKYEGVLRLRPGKYLVKFLIDGTNWRIAPDWPTENNSNGETDNVLIVD